MSSTEPPLALSTPQVRRAGRPLRWRAGGPNASQRADIDSDTKGEAAAAWAAELGNPSYAVDEQTAIAVVDAETTVVSEGVWRHFP